MPGDLVGVRLSGRFGPKGICPGDFVRGILSQGFCSGIMYGGTWPRKIRLASRSNIR